MLSSTWTRLLQLVLSRDVLRELQSLPMDESTVMFVEQAIHSTLALSPANTHHRGLLWAFVELSDSSIKAQTIEQAAVLFDMFVDKPLFVN